MKLKTLKPTLRTLAPTLPTVSGSGWRAGKTTTQRGYGYRWQKARERFLWRNPICCYCEREGRVEEATIVDHRIPHRGDQALFWDESNWQPMCKTHHDGQKAREERGSPTAQRIGSDGWPVDPAASADMPTPGGMSQTPEGSGF